MTMTNRLPPLPASNTRLLKACSSPAGMLGCVQERKKRRGGGGGYVDTRCAGGTLRHARTWQIFFLDEVSTLKIPLSNLGTKHTYNIVFEPSMTTSKASLKGRGFESNVCSRLKGLAEFSS